MLSAQRPRGRSGRGRGREQAEAGRARARHARKPAALECAQIGEHLRNHRRDRDRRRFEVVAARPASVSIRSVAFQRRRASKSAPLAALPRASSCARSAANTSLVGTATPRIDQHRRQLRQRERIGQDFADAAHHARARIEAHRHVGAGDARRLASAADRRARCGWRGRAAAAPPPRRTSRRRRPAATGSRLVSTKRPSLRPSTRSASARAALSTRLSSIDAGRRRGRPVAR